MSDDWFIERGKQIAGPFTVKQVKELAASGRLTSNDGIRRGPDGEFVAASKARGLFEADDKADRPSAPAVSQTTADAAPGTGNRSGFVLRPLLTTDQRNASPTPATPDTTPKEGKPTPSKAWLIAVLLGMVLFVFIFRNHLPDRGRNARREKGVLGEQHGTPAQPVASQIAQPKQQEPSVNTKPKFTSLSEGRAPVSAVRKEMVVKWLTQPDGKPIRGSVFDDPFFVPAEATHYHLGNHRGGGEGSVALFEDRATGKVVGAIVTCPFNPRSNAAQNLNPIHLMTGDLLPEVSVRAVIKEDPGVLFAGGLANRESGKATAGVRILNSSEMQVIITVDAD